MKYKLRLINDLQDSIAYLGKYGIIHFDAKLWKDEIIFETVLSFDEVRNLPFVISVKRFIKDTF